MAMPQNFGEEQVKLLLRCERAERRAAAVEEEMVEMARQNAREIATLKVRLAEKDAQLLGGFGGMSNLPLGDIGGAMAPADEFASHRASRPLSGGRRGQLAPLGGM